ncbi:hypothetical protein GCM10009720_17910 [Yaniella flava]|uniref:Transposase IS204/IS1001/IS1096/IS1165 DDE domain-containing protein n=1 Tax=Yaniella flava TaxID=287930 RepID=A0ABP5G3Y9_9MICC
MVAPGEKLSYPAALWALKSVVIDRLAIARVAENLGVSWHTANDAVLETGRRLLIADPNRLNGVRVLGVDEHVWRHTRWGNRYVTVVIDLTPVADGTGPARLLAMVPGRSKQTFITWLEAQTSAFRAAVEIVAMDGFTGYKTAAAETLPEATTVMDPFHVVTLAGQAVDKARQRIQQDTLGHRGRKGDQVVKQTTRNEIDYAASGFSGEEEAREYFDPMLAQAQDVPGYEQTMEYGETSAVEELVIDYSVADPSDLAELPGYEASDNMDVADYVSLEESRQLLLNSGFTEVE